MTQKKWRSQVLATANHVARPVASDLQSQGEEVEEMGTQNRQKQLHTPLVFSRHDTSHPFQVPINHPTYLPPDSSFNTVVRTSTQTPPRSYSQLKA